MSYEVRIEPSGRRFTALPEETLLEAALRSGINVRYNCSNGTCGECQVNLKQGEVEPVMHSDYHFSLQERNDNAILLCTNRATSDLVIEAAVAHSTEDIPQQHLIAKVAKVEERGEKMRILHLRTPRTKVLRFMAGQHVCLKLDGVGSCDAAIGSCPCNGMHLQFHIPAREGDPFIDAVYDGLRVGQKIEVEGPYGDVTLDDESPRPLLMLAMGSDFAPIKSLIEHAINLDLQQPIRLVWLAPENEGHYLMNHARSWGEVLDDYAFVPLTMKGDEPERGERELLLRTIDEQLAGLEDVDAYIAGSSLFREISREHLLTLGVEASRVFPLRRRYAVREAPMVAQA